MEKAKTTKTIMVCPKCGSTDIEFIAPTSALFKVNPDGSIGNLILDKEGIDCINACKAIDNIECYCQKCDYGFEVSEKEEGGLRIIYNNKRNRKISNIF